MRAIVNRPVLLLADKPTGAIDAQTTQEILNILTELNAAGMTIEMITHIPEVARITKQVIWFKDRGASHFCRYILQPLES
jgi:putative ABC transport system ATP-binding protein